MKKVLVVVLAVAVIVLAAVAWKTHIEYRMLMADYEALEVEYADLESEYETLAKEYESLQAEYGELSEEHEVLKKNHHDLTAEHRELTLDSIVHESVVIAFVAEFSNPSYDYESWITKRVEEEGFTMDEYYARMESIDYVSVMEED